MKKRRPHIVPIPRQIKELLLQLKPITGRYELIFPGRNDRTIPISYATIYQVIEYIGYKGRATGHGFRHQMSTILNDKGFNSDWIDMQLSHVQKNKIRGIYNHANYLKERRKIMQWYADYLDSLERDGYKPDV